MQSLHRDKLRMSRLAIYMLQLSGHGQFEFTYNQFSCDAVQNANQQLSTGHKVYLAISLTGNTGKQS